jgi:hypothetical protein
MDAAEQAEREIPSPLDAELRDARVLRAREAEPRVERRTALAEARLLAEDAL